MSERTIKLTMIDGMDPLDPRHHTQVFLIRINDDGVEIRNNGAPVVYGDKSISTIVGRELHTVAVTLKVEGA